MSQRSTTARTMYAMVRYCLSVELDAIDRECRFDVENRDEANEENTLVCEVTS